jgi:hypothetical protein
MLRAVFDGVAARSAGEPLPWPLFLRRGEGNLRGRVVANRGRCVVPEEEGNLSPGPSSSGLAKDPLP